MDNHPEPLTAVPVPPALHATRLTAVAAALVVIGAASFVGMLLAGEQRHAWASLLQGMIIPTWIGVGGLFFIAVHSVCNGGWITPLRRVMEGLTAGLPLTLAAFGLIAGLGASYLYEWVAHPTGQAHLALFHAHNGVSSKASWMTWNRWVATSICIIMLWMFMRKLLVGLSLRQDQGTGAAAIARVHLRTSIVWLFVFALTFTLFTWDMLLSLHVGFASTMWGVYCFTSAVQTFLAVTVVAAVWLRSGPLARIIESHTLHDLGTWTLGWGCFCAYIAFAQYLVIYYANMDEETVFLLTRLQHGYGAAYAAEYALRFLLPFAALMSQSMRARPAALAAVSALILLGNWMDWSWIIMPAFSPNLYQPFWDLPTLAVGLGFAGALLLLALAFWRRHGLVPKGDPRLLPTINAEHLH